MKVAIIRLSSLGDIVHAAASLQIIRRSFPSCHISMVIDKRFSGILDHQPDIDNVIEIDLKGLFKQRPLLPAIFSEYRRLASFGPFDAVVDLHGMIKSAVIGAMLGGKKIGRRRSREFLAKFFYNKLMDLPFIQSSAIGVATMIADCINCEFDPTDVAFPRPYLFWTPEDTLITDDYFSGAHRNILFVPGSSTPHKDYPTDLLAQLANILKENILICHGSPKEFEAATWIAERSPYARVLPRLSLNQLKAVIGMSDLVVGGDTGPVHLASACGTSSITLFGSTKVCFKETECNRAIVAPLADITSGGDGVSDRMSRIAPDEIARVAKEIFGHVSSTRATTITTAQDISV